MAIGVLCVNGQIRRHMDEGGEGEKEEELTPCFTARSVPNHGQRGIDGNGIKPCDEILHGRLEIEFIPHLRTRHPVHNRLIRRPKINRDIGNERTEKQSKITFSLPGFGQGGKGKESVGR